MRRALDIWRFRAEIAGLRTGLWLLTRTTEPIHVSADVHRFFVDRYLRLADHHRRRGHHDRAKRLFVKAVLHWRAIGLNDPPPSVAAVMPLPLPPIFTWAVAGNGRRSLLRDAA